jgi:hypothetical protein
MSSTPSPSSPQQPDPELLEAVNAYLLAQNTYGFKDRGGAPDARRTLCRVAYARNVAAAPRRLSLLERIRGSVA